MPLSIRAEGSSRERMVASKKTSWPGVREVASGPRAAMRPMAELPGVKGRGTVDVRVLVSVRDLAGLFRFVFEDLGQGKQGRGGSQTGILPLAVVDLAGIRDDVAGEDLDDGGARSDGGDGHGLDLGGLVEGAEEDGALGGGEGWGGGHGFFLSWVAGFWSVEPGTDEGREED